MLLFSEVETIKDNHTATYLNFSLRYEVQWPSFNVSTLRVIHSPMSLLEYC